MTAQPQSQAQMQAVSAQSLAAAFAGMQRTAAAAAQAREPPFLLADLVNHSNIAGLVETNTELQQSLIPLLPRGLQTREE